MIKNNLLLSLVVTILLFGTTYSAILEDNIANLNTNSKLGFVNGK